MTLYIKFGTKISKNMNRMTLETKLWQKQKQGGEKVNYREATASQTC